MLASPDAEALLQGFGIAYDPGLLARHRVMFAIMLRKYLAHYDCMDEEYAIDPDGGINRDHPKYPLIRSCVATAWSELEDKERRSRFAEQFGGGCSSGGCGPCPTSSCGDRKETV